MVRADRLTSLTPGGEGGQPDRIKTVFIDDFQYQTKEIMV